MFWLVTTISIQVSHWLKGELNQIVNKTLALIKAPSSCNRYWSAVRFKLHCSKFVSFSMSFFSSRWQGNNLRLKKWQVALVQLDPLCELIWRQVEKRSASWYSFKYWLVFGGTGSVEGTACWYLEEMGRYWLVLDCTWSVEGGTGCYLVVLGQHRMVLVGTWWYWIKTERYWLPVWCAYRKYLVYMV